MLYQVESGTGVGLVRKQAQIILKNLSTEAPTVNSSFELTVGSRESHPGQPAAGMRQPKISIDPEAGQEVERLRGGIDRRLQPSKATSAGAEPEIV